MNHFKTWTKPFHCYLQRRLDLRRMKTLPLNQERLIYQCALDGRKRHNLAMQSASRYLLKHIELSYPHILHVGVTTRCNLHCPACPTGTSSLGRAGEDLDVDLYCRVVDRLNNFLLLMMFWDWGEPLLHPHLPDMIAHAGKSGIKTIVSTNGTVANSTRKMERLVSAGPTTIIVCVDGADQQTYQTYRRGGKLKTVLQTIRRLAETKSRLGQLYPLIEFRSLATRATEHQMPELLKLARNNGADLFTVKTLRPYNYRGYSIDEILVPQNESLSRYRYENGALKSTHRRGFVSQGALQCAKPLYAPTLNADGVLAFCSYAQHADEFFGDLGKRSVADVWKDTTGRTRRLNFLKAGGTRSCRTCYFRNDHNPTIIHQVPLGVLPEDISVEAPQTPDEFLETVSRGNRLETPPGKN